MSGHGAAMPARTGPAAAIRCAIEVAGRSRSHLRGHRVEGRSDRRFGAGHDQGGGRGGRGICAGARAAGHRGQHVCNSVLGAPCHA
eukprot:1968433-Prymnesium_polylepis.1